ncbi:hypothetical protein KSS87_021271 [Heliosperma pusillum]|nr:hypothetical protein KSS87_021271 [Heliosperma pusillum]
MVVGIRRRSAKVVVGTTVGEVNRWRRGNWLFVGECGHGRGKWSSVGEVPTMEWTTGGVGRVADGVVAGGWLAGGGVAEGLSKLKLMGGGWLRPAVAREGRWRRKVVACSVATHGWLPRWQCRGWWRASTRAGEGVLAAQGVARRVHEMGVWVWRHWGAGGGAMACSELSSRETNSKASGLFRVAKQRKDAIKKRRYRRSRSAPLMEIVPEEVNEIACARTPESPFWKVNPNLIKVAAFLSAYLVVGAICFYAGRHHISGKKTNDIIDALYFCVVTMTTVGYGDLVPRSDLAKLLACVFVFMGVALVGLILSKGADYLVEKQEKMLVRAWHMSKEFGPSDVIKEIETNKARYKCVLVFLILLVLILIGTLFLTFVEKLDIIDAFYCVCCTITTLGYGDHSFSTEGGRLFAVFWILMSTICVAQFFLYIAELNTENRQKDLVKQVLRRRMTNLDLEAADIDDDGVVDAAEFALYKLKEMGKITQEDLALVFEEFEELDADQSGTLSASDIAQAQSYPEATEKSAKKERS